MANHDEAAGLRRLSQQHAYTTIRLHEAIGRQIGLPGTDHKYLGLLLQHQRLTAGELARLTGLTTGAVTGLIDRFAKKKLVKRQVDKEDRRRVIVVPHTEKIRALLAPYYKDFQADTEAFFGGFTTAEAKVLRKFFDGAIALMLGKIEHLQANDV